MNTPPSLTQPDDNSSPSSDPLESPFSFVFTSSRYAPTTSESLVELSRPDLTATQLGRHAQGAINIKSTLQPPSPTVDFIPFSPNYHTRSAHSFSIQSSCSDSVLSRESYAQRSRRSTFGPDVFSGRSSVSSGPPSKYLPAHQHTRASSVSAPLQRNYLYGGSPELSITELLWTNPDRSQTRRGPESVMRRRSSTRKTVVLDEGECWKKPMLKPDAQVTNPPKDCLLDPKFQCFQ
ncbi:hypothetical protein HETIRDRAFT_449870 [Heterobasidion irregulare TC 32-1]|uniref:Uncharacterized protein n=1 Tax=Heterobasidion irregulare (strain TC 32-1) TaxID=747525 RepID=W4KF89_HETIT|nr:uncharacterized protein HETIRDRAFT_449870 [Heterobasidion irregulare TC 32-1]ETW84384.1 hypothetical protein HETIRDRAFT_449870 [Heterobasidion irregulare TC 32-1]